MGEFGVENSCGIVFGWLCTGVTFHYLARRRGAMFFPPPGGGRLNSV